MRKDIRCTECQLLLFSNQIKGRSCKWAGKRVPRFGIGQDQLILVRVPIIPIQRTDFTNTHAGIERKQDRIGGRVGRISRR